MLPARVHGHVAVIVDFAIKFDIFSFLSCIVNVLCLANVWIFATNEWYLFDGEMTGNKSILEKVKHLYDVRWPFYICREL
jgi:hypothetical protein